MTNHDKCYDTIEIDGQNEKPSLEKIVREALPEEVAFKVRSEEWEEKVTWKKRIGECYLIEERARAKVLRLEKGHLENWSLVSLEDSGLSLEGQAEPCILSKSLGFTLNYETVSVRAVTCYNLHFLKITMTIVCAKTTQGSGKYWHREID